MTVARFVGTAPGLPDVLRSNRSHANLAVSTTQDVVHAECCHAESESLSTHVLQGCTDQHDVACITWEKLLEIGACAPASPKPGGADTLCTIMYTSGTTGDPKGVELSHRAVLAAVGALARLAQQWNIQLGCALCLVMIGAEWHR
jgi:long-subunit acyl-CoA synthetase (AMP-forming)